jgi:hypothetical protein
VNVSPEHAQVIRDAIAAGLTCWLVVPADLSRVVKWDGDVPRKVYTPPADWVTLTGAEHLSPPCPRHAQAGHVESCFCPSRKRATLTVERHMRANTTEARAQRFVPLAAATVEVLPVRRRPDALTDADFPGVFVLIEGQVIHARASADWEYLALHRQPVPDKDYVIHLTNLEAQ